MLVPWFGTFLDCSGKYVPEVQGCW